MVKDEAILALLFIIILDLASSLYLSQSSVTTEPGKSLAISCRDTGGQSVMWKGPKGTLSANTKPKIQDTSIGKLLVFTPTRVQDTGNYTCSLISNKHEYSIFSLIVEESIEFKDTPEIQRGREGENVTLRCEVNRPYTISWPSVELGTKYVAIGDGLLIVNVSREDNRVFICQAIKSSTGRFLEKKITFVVEHKPVPVKIPRDPESADEPPVYAQDDEIYGFLGENVNLTCEVEAEPPPQFEWKSVKQGRNKIGRILNVGSHKSILELKMTRDTPDKYQCTATNKYGKLKKFINLQIGTRPKPPGKIELLKAGPHSLELKVEIPENEEEDVNNDMEPKWLNVFYRTGYTEDWDEQDFNITLDTFLLTELNSSTKYEIVSATRNVAGLSALSNATYFETTAGSVQISQPTFFSLAMIYSLIFLTSQLA